MVEHEPDLYLDELQNKLWLRTGALVTVSTIWRALSQKFGYSRKVFSAKAAQRDETARAAFRQTMRAVGDPSCFVWLDETASSKQAFESRRAWARRGSKVCINKYFSKDGPMNATLLAAADINGFILPMCELVLQKRGDSDTDATHGTIGQERFEAYIKECVIPNMNTVGPRSIVILDNASPHWAPTMLQLFADAGIRVIFLPAYSPDYNPIEMMFAQYKSVLKRGYKTGRYTGRYGDLHRQGLLSVTRDHACNYALSCGCYRNVPIRAAQKGLGVRAAVLAVVLATLVATGYL
jgi:transposase